MTDVLKRRAEDVRSPYVLEEQVGFHLRRAQQRATDIFNDVMAEFGVTPTQFAALAKLDDGGPTSQNQLGRLTAMDPATISSVVGRLAKRGYVALAPAPADARLVMASLTPEGAVAIAAMRKVAGTVSERTLRPLTRVEADVFVDLLKRLG
jgi:DNA-binding MarR family transcriptional regulator